MSVWKSPVFYFGILLVLALVAALAAPFVVPWNNYKGDLENYGRRLSGRDVKVEGDIAVRLFPWPQLTAQQVSIGNPDGFVQAPIMQAETMAVRLSLGGLFSGQLDVERIEVISPRISLQRNAAGDVNWLFVPEGDVVGQGLLATVKLDQIAILNGTISWDDLRNGQSTLVTGLDAELSAAAITGPWRMKGNAKWQDVPLALTVSTTAKEVGQDLRFAVKVSPLDARYPHVSLEGGWDGKRFSGNVRADPQEQTGEKTSLEGTFKPLALQADIDADEARTSLTKIRIAPADREDNGTLIEGDAVVEWGTETVARVDLRAPRVNLDTLLGVGTLQQWRDGGFLSVANSLLLNTPPRFVTDVKVGVNVLTSGGQSLNNVRLTGRLQREAFRVHEFTGELPGRSAGVFAGVLFPGDALAQLKGKIAFESADTRSFLTWLFPDWREAIALHWTGSRGRLDVSDGELYWTAKGLSLSGLNYAFDSQEGKGNINLTTDPKSSVSVALQLAGLDADSLVPNGWSLLRDGGLSGFIKGYADGGQNRIERIFDLSIGNMLLNGVTAQKLNLNAALSDQGLNLTAISLGNVGGATLSGSGVLQDAGSGPEGELSFTLKAEDPRGFLRLVGLDDGAAQWTQPLGLTDATVKVLAQPQKSGPEVSLTAVGTSGQLAFDVDAHVSNLEKGFGATLAVSGGLRSENGGAMAALIGIAPAKETGPGLLNFEFKGARDDGFTFGGELTALNAKAEMTGKADLLKPFMGLAGKARVSAADGAAVVAALGVPLVTKGSQPLTFDTSFLSSADALGFPDLQAHIAGRRFGGSVEVRADGGFEANLETDALDARDVASLALMPWDGPVSDATQSFADVGGKTLRGEIYVKPLVFETNTGHALREALVAIGLEPAQRRVTVQAPGDGGAKADILLKPQGTGFALTGSVRWPVLLAGVLADEKGEALATGDVILEGTFAASGRSPAAALAALEGKGSYWLSEGTMARLSLNGLSVAVLAAKTPDDLSRALAQLDAKPGTVIGQRIGNVDVKNGAVQFSAFDVAVEGAKAVVTPRFDAASLVLALESAVTLPARPDLPAMQITYAGAPGALAVRNGTSALAAKLGYDLLSKEMAELEKLQKEQQALAAKEELQRKEDEQRFADYQATKAELRSFTRVRRFHQTIQEQRGKDLEAMVQATLKTSSARARTELQRHARRLEIRRLVVAPPPPVLPSPTVLPAPQVLPVPPVLPAPPLPPALDFPPALQLPSP